jgi:hypothetical protein
LTLPAIATVSTRLSIRLNPERSARANRAKYLESKIDARSASSSIACAPATLTGVSQFGLTQGIAALPTVSGAIGEGVQAYHTAWTENYLIERPINPSYGRVKVDCEILGEVKNIS